MYGQPRFSEVTPQQLVGVLKATGSTDPDVLAAALDQFAAPYRPLKWFGIWGMVTGGLCTIMIVLAFIGIPIFIFGVWAFRRARKNAQVIDTTYREYMSQLGVAVPSVGTAQPGLRAVG